MLAFNMIKHAKGLTMKSSSTLVASLLAAACSAAAPHVADVQTQPSTDTPWPEASAGMVRHTIWLPAQQDEQVFKVELLPGQIQKVDCNQHNFSGRLETKNLQGWGYDYYVFTPASMMVSTRIACPDGGGKRKFVTAWLGNNAMLRYNSQLPIVVYTPDNIDLKYRIWQAGETQYSEIKKKPDALKGRA